MSLDDTEWQCHLLRSALWFLLYRPVNTFRTFSSSFLSDRRDTCYGEVINDPTAVLQLPLQLSLRIQFRQYSLEAGQTLLNPHPSKAAGVCWLCNKTTREQILFTSPSEGVHTVYARSITFGLIFGPPMGCRYLVLPSCWFRIYKK